VSKVTPTADPEAVGSSLLNTRALDAINLMSSLFIVALGSNEKVAVELGFIIKAACIDSVITLQLTKEDKEAVLKISLPLTPSILK